MTKKILILGATGMLGHTLYTQLSELNHFEVYATVRSNEGLSKWFSQELLSKVISGVDGDNFDSVIRAAASIKPDLVINCIGLIKQLKLAQEPLRAITVNSQLPHRIALLCEAIGARMIHISTDCVFNGAKGNYTEDDSSDAIDLYGKTKYLGEVSYPHCFTIRTSIIGHELKGSYGLIDWFLSQEGSVKGYTNAIFSGFPTVEIARLISEYIIPNENLNGLYQVSAEPISKYELLKQVTEIYQKKIEIIPFEDFKIDRSLNSFRFRKATGYSPPTWPELIKAMYQNYLDFGKYQK